MKKKYIIKERVSLENLNLNLICKFKSKQFFEI